ncbi:MULTISPECIES: gephyrin-like molybdotransferase receptor GlpR [Mycobacterium]|uniref:divisome protein SepX/GlpR n=1 Tax=Mycobacterium TaxID=1763 RepID=UPI0005C6655E|nr:MULTISPECIES: gephyrin-like molybdotransferase receptor GlpR [Mycobacterium]WSE50510.1 gephyrin-like molybdotransferase receptor GlpR [Mycobacterium sp. 2-64]
MPSIPQSLLWISLVVLWLFVLVPMLVSKRDAVRRTSDVALATRVLNGGANSRLIKRSGPAAGHRSDPDWQPPEDSAGTDLDEEHDLAENDDDRETDDDADTDELSRRRPVVMKMAVTEPAEADEPDYLDVDVVEDSAALPVGASDSAAEDVDEEPAEDDVDTEAVAKHDDEDRYEYVEDSSGLEPAAEGDDADDEAPAPIPRNAARRRRLDAKTAAAVSARKYAFRKKVLMMMAVFLIGSATAAFKISPSAWWVCGSATGITLLYLGYLRRQTRIEEKVRRRRMKRMARARLGVENAYDREYDVVPSRLRRPGAVVLEIDDEDPVFEHLDYAMAMRTYGWPRDLPRAVGE